MIALALLLAAAEAAPPGAALASALRGVRQDGAVTLSDAAQADLLAMLPPPRKGEECPEPAKVTPDAQGLRDRGDGPLLVAEVTSCKGARVFALSTGEPLRMARLLDLATGETLRSVKAVNLGGGRREDDLALELLTSPTVSELKLFSRRDTGFGFGLSGTLRDYTGLRECAAGGDEGSGWASWLRPGKDGVQVLRVDSTCAGAPWQASCVLYELEREKLSRGGVCPLPARLEPRPLRAAGWK